MQNSWLAGIATALALVVLWTIEARAGVDFSASAGPLAGIERMEPLPAQQFSWFVSGGRNFLLSENGRIAITGESLRIRDLWTGADIARIEDVAALRRIPIARAPIDVRGELATISTGAGPERTTIFLDPLCPHCAELLRQLDTVPASQPLDLVLYPVLGPDSQRIARKLECVRQKDPAQALDILRTKGWSRLAEVEDCGTTALQKTFVVARLFGIQGVPFLIAPNGETHAGTPKSLAEFIAANLATPADAGDDK